MACQTCKTECGADGIVTECRNVPGRNHCLFARNDADGPAFYCGHSGDRPDMLKGIGHIVESQIDDLLGGHIDKVTIVFTRKLLTDAEIAALPDCD